MKEQDYVGTWFIDWDGHTVRETLEMSLREDGKYDVRHSGDGASWDTVDFDRLTPGLSMFHAIDQCVHIVEKFEPSMRTGNKNELLGALLSDAGVIEPWRKHHGNDFRALSRGAAARRERAEISITLTRRPEISSGGRARL